MARDLHHLLLLAALLQQLSATSAGDVATGSGGEKVHVAIYYESLCPYSARFVTNHLLKAYRDGLLDAADLTLVPYGNAKVDAHGAITCQHGPDECLLNTVQACAIDAWPDVKVHLGFIYCVSDLVMKNRHREWESCFQKQGLDPKPVTECYKGERGHNLSLEYGRQTAELVPPHQFVPWVVVDGKPLYNDYGKFEAYICKAYKGYPLLEACRSPGMEAENDVYGRL
ncbi:hypothetical protein CFC21_051922 [Triticum aestivum]|uniref:Gamma-interferon-inducible lysosomal thiol reductase n=2 Tax=Triticum aestivum TaxID=4565 RepID=A0A9R1G7N3_WHEAT|nr:gamma-interferon-responsive lysosomal thiol protein-like [Triticum aestivum]KAF7042276.1 hypothetical protein CFC21_051922 [Triticum aestivum]